jgi:hypothetical protein
MLQQQQHHQQQQQQFGGQQYVGQVLTTPAAPYAGGNTQMRHQRTSDIAPAGAAAGWNLQQQQQQQQCYGAAGGQQHWQHPSAAAAGDACWDKQSTAASTSSNSSSSSSPVRAGVAHTHSLLLPGKGDVFLQMGTPVSAAADSSSSGKRQKRDSWGFAGPLNSRVHGSSQAVAAASILSAGGVAAAGVPLGLQLAAALTADPTNSGHVVVPMLLLGEWLVCWSALSSSRQSIIHVHGKLFSCVRGANTKDLCAVACTLIMCIVQHFLSHLYTAFSMCAAWQLSSCIYAQIQHAVSA